MFLSFYQLFTPFSFIFSRQNIHRFILMENEVRVVEDIVEGVDDQLKAEQKAVEVADTPVHVQKEFDGVHGDDVFEEAMELAPDDRVDEDEELEPNFEEVDVHVSGNVATNGLIAGRDGMEVKNEPFPTNSPDVNHYESASNVPIMSVNGTALHQDLGAATISGSEIDVLTVEETKAINGEEDSVDKSAAVETSLIMDLEEMESTNGDPPASHDSKEEGLASTVSTFEKAESSVASAVNPTPSYFSATESSTYPPLPLVRPAEETETTNGEEDSVDKSAVVETSLIMDLEEMGGNNGEPPASHDSKEESLVSTFTKAESSVASAVTPAPSSFSASETSTNPSRPPIRPAGLGRAAPLSELAPKAVQQPRANGQASQVQTRTVEDSTNADIEEGDEIREKLQMIRVKFLRLAYRLGQTPHNVVVAQVLYRLGLAEQLRARNRGRVGAFNFDRASAMAQQLEAAGQEPVDFSCTIMVLGKTGVGKSATINSIFDEVKFSTDAFQAGTMKVQDVFGTVQGIKVRVIDTPGLLSSITDQRQNEKILHSVKRFISKSPPDIVFYLDRLDMPSRDFGDTPHLKTITDIFGQSIWFNAIVVLTHAATAPLDGPNGTPSTYDMFVTQRSHAVQQAIRQAAGDMRLMNPVCLVENHSACRTNRAGQRVLPNGQVWKPHLLLLSFASKILAEANMILKLQDSPPNKPFASRSRAQPLPFLLSSLLQSRPQLKLPEEQYTDDDDLDESSDIEEESEYDELPQFKPLTKAQLSKLTKAQRKAYYDEVGYREKLFMKKQLKEERRQRKMMKKMAAEVSDMIDDYSENVEAATVPVPMPDMALPDSFDSDNPTHRYRYLDTSNQWLVRPVLDNHGWDHDVGYEGINVERTFVVKKKIPLSFSGQVSKDKKEANLQMEIASSVKHGEGKATTLGFDMQSVGKDMAYTLRSETGFCNYRRNKATLGLSATLLGDALSAGLKVEDKLTLTKQLGVVMSGGAMANRGDIAYGGSLEATLRDKDYPMGRFLSTLGLSIMDWHGELALGCNVQSQIPVGRSTNLIARANLNNRGSGQVSFRMNSSEQLQLALIGLLPLLRKLMLRQEQPLDY